MNIPGYNIIKELGRGGMATVYLAEQLSLGRKVALKVMAPALAADAGFGERFLREARTAASLSHPGIMSVYDVGVDGHSYYIAMEYIPGGDLKQKLRHANLSPEVALKITSNVAAALGHAHSKGFVHRDVKPENILFREDGTPVLADFGIAKATGSGTKMTGTGMSIGTPHYMSPEQARGQQVDGRSDLYSLGVVLYEMVTGQVPFEAEDSFAVAYAHINNPVPSLPSALSHIQPLLERLLAKNPADRYSTAASLITDIDKLTQGKPLPAAATPKPSRPQASQRTLVMSSPAPQSKGSSAVTWLLAGAFLAMIVAGGFWYMQQQNTPRLASGGSQIGTPVRQEKQSPSTAIVPPQQRLVNEDNSIGVPAQLIKTKLQKTVVKTATPQPTPEQKKHQQIKELLHAAEGDLKSMRLTQPARNCALDKYQQILQLEPKNKDAFLGEIEVLKAYGTLLGKAIDNGAYEKLTNLCCGPRRVVLEILNNFTLFEELRQNSKEFKEQLEEATNSVGGCIDDHPKLFNLYLDRQNIAAAEIELPVYLEYFEAYVPFAAKLGKIKSTEVDKIIKKEKSYLKAKLVKAKNRQVQPKEEYREIKVLVKEGHCEEIILKQGYYKKVKTKGHWKNGLMSRTYVPGTNKEVWIDPVKEKRCFDPVYEIRKVKIK